MEILDLKDRKGLVIGIANEDSLAWSATQHFRNAGADLAVTYLNDKAKPFVEPLAKEVESPIFLPCNVMEPGQLEAVFEQIRKDWGRLDFVFHAIAWARKEDLHHAGLLPFLHPHGEARRAAHGQGRQSDDAQGINAGRFRYRRACA